MKLPTDPDETQKRFEGKLAGTPGQGFGEVTERKPTLGAPEFLIPKSELRHGAYYRGSCRNATIARWNAEKQLFYHWRTKWGLIFLETIKHRDDDDRYDVFDAFEEIPPPEKEIPFD